MKYIDLFLLLPLIITVLLLGVTYPFKKKRLSQKLIEKLFYLISMSSLLCSLFVIINSLVIKTNFFGFINLEMNTINAIIYFFSSLLLTLICRFSFKYIHKEIGFYKFFLNLAIFWLGHLLFVFEDNYLVLFAGWELIGVSSIFLISFYNYRKAPLKNALYVMSFYKVADIILITSLLLMSHSELLSNHATYLQYVYIGLVIAGLIKSASFPFTSWLPKAMEGPTTSSAIFYVSLSVNTGIILIYKFLPEILSLKLSSTILMISGVLTIAYSSVVSRVQSDAKSMLGYSSSIQLGIVLIELSLGYSELALMHLYFNSFYKLYQFIKSPSLLTSYHSMVGENRSLFKQTGAHFEYLLPKKIRNRLYYYALNGFYVDNILVNMKIAISKLSVVAEQLFFPLINKTEKHTYRTMFWCLYYIIVIGLVSVDAFVVSNSYFDIIPFVILLVSFSLLFEKNENSFIAMLMIYKILESFIVHGVHSHMPYKWVSVFILGLFIFLIIKYEKNNIRSKGTRFLYGSVLIFLMLYFTNFPFLLQSLVNEHIIEAFLEKDKIMDLGFYCLANTFLNIGLYNFIFHKVYFKEAIDG